MIYVLIFPFIVGHDTPPILVEECCGCCREKLRKYEVALVGSCCRCLCEPCSAYLPGTRYHIIRVWFAEDATTCNPESAALVADRAYAFMLAGSRPPDGIRSRPNQKPSP